MKSLKLQSCYALAAAAVVGIAACSNGGDASSSIAAPSGPNRIITSAAVGDAGNGVPNQGELELCKTGDAGSFEVTDGVTTRSYNLAAGECVVAWVDVRTGLDTARLTVTELPSMTSTFTSVEITTINNEYDPNVNGAGPDLPTSTTVSTTSTQQVKLNEYIGSRLVYLNTLNPPPEEGCTYTKGWYRNNGSETIIATADGLTKPQQQQVFNATPGKPGLVTWTGGNNTLNLYQQLLAAINNLGGDETGGPAAVDAAIAAAKAGTNVTTLNGGVQIGLVAGTDVSGLIATLSSFNEGSLTGFPHCGDEVVAR